jgi:tRNA (guanine10-N2)-methyltransferase
MLDDILVFATDMLVDDGRISFWMPTANDEEQDIPVPTHPSLELTSLCVQPFYKCRSYMLIGPPHPHEEPSGLTRDENRVEAPDHISADTRRRGLASCAGGVSQRKEGGCGKWEDSGRPQSVPGQLL